MAELSYHPEAKDEIREAAAFYERSRQGLGEEFLAEIEAVIGKIKLNPLRCSKINGLFRCCQTKRFPYGIIYAVEDDGFSLLPWHTRSGDQDTGTEDWVRRIRS